MNNQQPVYLFAGGRGRAILSTFSNIRKIIKNIQKKKPAIAFVGAASLKDNWLVYALISVLIKAGCNCQIQRVVIAPPNADLDKAKTLLQNADAVFMSGGDVEAGMQVLTEKNMVGFFQELARQGKIFIGVSAGSIMLSKEWVRWSDPSDDSTIALLPCLGIVPLICDTHAEKDSWVELKTAIQLKGPGTTGYGITSGACLRAYPDGRLEASEETVTCFTTINDKIEKQPDLLPGEKKG
jgi:peptidase E